MSAANAAFTAKASKTLKILAVSEDRTALRHLTKFLTAFGYEVFTAADVHQATAAFEAHEIDFLIIDDRTAGGGAEVSRRLTHNTEQRLFKFLLSTNREAQSVQEALAAGVDDFLTRPLVHAELLTRLRAGARALENRRRWDEQQQLEPKTNLPSKAAFHCSLTQHLEATGKSSKTVACGILDVDFFDRVRRTHGQTVRDDLLQQAARRLEELIRPIDELACFGNDRFGLLLHGCSEREAVAEVERICDAFAATEFSCGEFVITLTISAGVSGWHRDSADVDEILQHTEKALGAAKSSGRGCVVRYGQFGDETNAWHELAAPGRLFESTNARDVMTPCPLILDLDDPFHKATTVFEQTELLALPVVDRSGNFTGIVWRESFVNGRDIHETYPAGHAQGPVRDQLDDAIECVEEDATFADLVERLSDDSTPLLVVADTRRRPTGLVTALSLASLSQPLSADSFHSDKPYDDSTHYLSVAEDVQH